TPLNNPVTGNAQISVNLPSGGPVSLAVFDTVGRQVAGSLHQLQSGSSQLEMNTSQLPPGMYMVRADAAGSSATSRLMILR
ncbi:MAG TPA: T9SS type A sorting domain-containing protein, partial [Candidatus Sabulitectum sp.]|nr:T9SS type A sorting domain-containing protein [Candidatus Sabulitectum sp.]